MPKNRQTNDIFKTFKKGDKCSQQLKHKKQVKYKTRIPLQKLKAYFQIDCRSLTIGYAS